MTTQITSLTQLFNQEDPNTISPAAFKVFEAKALQIKGCS